MNPDLFLEDQQDVVGLVVAMAKFANRDSTPHERQAVLKAAGVNLPFLQCSANSVSFAQQL
jgi:hypothetical protein